MSHRDLSTLQLEDFDLSTSKTELLFGEYFYKHLAPGAKAAVIVPEGVLFGSSSAHKKLGKWLLDDKWPPQPEKNNIPDLIKNWDEKPESKRSWFAGREEIRENDLNLTAGRYKPRAHEEVEYAKPKDIIAEVSGLEQKIAEGLTSPQKKL